MKTQLTEGKQNANMADNQVAFRRLNRKLEKLILELENIAVERGEPRHVFRSEDVYHFYCECSDENCVQRIQLSFEEYEEIHERDDTFCICLGHEVLDIEEIITKTPTYCVVKKFETPKQTNATFRATALDNS